VVVVDVDVAAGVYGQVNHGVAGEEFEHVVEKAHAGADLGVAPAVEVEAQADVGLVGLANDLGGTVAHAITRFRNKDAGTSVLSSEKT
jgi:hypothetical protein